MEPKVFDIRIPKGFDQDGLLVWLRSQDYAVDIQEGVLYGPRQAITLAVQKFAQFRLIATAARS